MNIGDKILEFRKRSNLSQEQLSEKIGVTRQTISKWELNETSPDLKQAKELSKVFNVSLDELADNDIKTILVQKISNTEKLAALAYKVLKVICVLFIIGFGLLLLSIVLFGFYKKEPETSLVKEFTLNCKLNNNEYNITVGSDGYYYCDTCDKKMNVYINDIVSWANMEHSEENVKTYFKNNGGICE